MKNPYEVLGVAKSASADEIKRAFRKLAHEHHPDKGGNEEKFKELNAAYQILGDEAKRKQYDQYGQTFDGAGPGGPGGFGGFNFNGMNFEDLGDIFGDLFQGGGRARHQRGRDIQVELELGFKEAIFGADKEVTLTKQNACERCGGVGAEPGSKMKTCDDCKGQGVKTTTVRTILGNMQTRTSCGKCHGSGEVPEKPCSTCRGAGSATSKKTLRVTVPPGVDDGMRIRIKGEGESIGSKGDAGDLYLLVSVIPDDRFERDGDTIHSQKKIGFTQAALGDEVDIETVDGIIKLTIPAGTQSGAELKLRGHGAHDGRRRGDHVVHIIVETPKHLSREQKDLLEKLDLRS